VPNGLIEFSILLWPYVTFGYYSCFEASTISGEVENLQILFLIPMTIIILVHKPTAWNLCYITQASSPSVKTMGRLDTVASLAQKFHLKVDLFGSAREPVHADVDVIFNGKPSFLLSDAPHRFKLTNNLNAICRLHEPWSDKRNRQEE